MLFVERKRDESLGALQAGTGACPMGDLCRMSAVDLRDSFPGMAGVSCGGAAIATVTFACIHEDVDAVRSCAACAAGLLDLPAGGVARTMGCPRCENLGEPRLCPCDVRINWDEGPVKVVQEVSYRWPPPTAAVVHREGVQ